MVTGNYTLSGQRVSTAPAPAPAAPRTAGQQPMHRIHSVRLQQGVSLRSAARATGIDVRQLRLQEQETTDLRLSDLHRWQRALEVPLSELIEDTDEPLSRPVMERARMVRIMKTAQAIKEKANSTGMRRLAEMLVEQLTEVMPELRDVGAWHTYGQRRTTSEYGRVVERCLSDDLVDCCDDEAA